MLRFSWLREWRPSVVAACLIFLFAGAATLFALDFGEHYIPADAGYPKESEPDLFRFDSYFYRDIATTGYAYNGNPGSTPNVVFAPLFPILVAGFSFITTLDINTAGFVLNGFLFFFALMFLHRALAPWVGNKPALFILLAMATSPGSYAFHAFYSEPTMLLALGLALWSVAQKRWALLAVSAAILGAARMAAVPVVCVIGLWILGEAWRRKSWRLIALSLFCGTGTFAYLAFLAWRFQNPFHMIPEIQLASWGLFHREVSWLGVLWGEEIWKDWVEVLNSGPLFWHPKTLNLACLTLGALSSVYMICKFPSRRWTMLFVAYYVFIYYSNTGSDFLISAHRFFALMIPIYIMFAGLHEWLARRVSPYAAWTVSGLLFAINLGFGIWDMACFNQGVWFYF